MTWPLQLGRDLNSFGGDYQGYFAHCYDIYWQDFHETRPTWPDGRRFSIKRHPEIDGKCATFWHMITEGDVESERIPDMARYERIGWPRVMIEEFCSHYPAPSNDNIAWWKSTRKGASRVLVALRDFTYVVVVEERNDYVMLWTAYPVEFSSRRRKLEDEWRRYWDAQGIAV